MASMNYLDYCVKYMAGQIYLAEETNRCAGLSRNQPLADCKFIARFGSIDGTTAIGLKIKHSKTSSESTLSMKAVNCLTNISSKIEIL